MAQTIKKLPAERRKKEEKRREKKRKKLPAMQETWVQSLGQKDPLERGMANRSSILAWRIPWTGAWRATVLGVAKNWT